MGARTNRRWEGGLAPVPRHHCAEGNRKTTQDDIRQAFNVFDKEQSGRISIDELTHVITTLGPDKLSPEQVAALVRDAGLRFTGQLRSPATSCSPTRRRMRRLQAIFLASQLQHSGKILQCNTLMHATSRYACVSCSPEIFFALVVDTALQRSACHPRFSTG